MSPTDKARLELARRAYQAAQPSALEVQSAVRRTRLSLRRPKQRRKWLLKGLVLVVLALGSLAYAKPHALGELVDGALPSWHAGSKQATALGTRATPMEVAAHNGPRMQPASEQQPGAPVVPDAVAEVPQGATPVSAPAPVVEEPRRSSTRRSTKPAAPQESRTDTGSGDPAPSPAPPPPATPPRSEESISDWGRVGQALARGDEAGALAALGKLAESDDARTRAKADLGRAQLMMAHGNRGQGCALARSLTHRRAGGHIERQALMLLKDCSR